MDLIRLEHVGSADVMYVTLSAADIVGNGAMAGLGIGGPWGAVVGGAGGLALYGLYAWTQPSTSCSLK